MKIILIYAMLLFGVSAYSQTREDVYNHLKIFTDEDVAIITKKRKIPKELIKKMSKENGEKFRISGKRRRYRNTDVISLTNFFLPKRKLIYLLNIKNEWLLVYHYGGRSHNIRCVYSNITNNKLVDEIFCVYFNYGDIKEFGILRKAINNKEFRIPEEISIKY